MKSILHIIFLFFFIHSFAQKEQRLILDKYTQNEGISSFNVKKIFQDKYGFLWVGTQYGLSKFDGRNFIVFDKVESKMLTGVDVRDFIEDKDSNQIWVLSATGGISVINTVSNKLVKRINMETGDNDEWDIGFIKCGGDIWINTSNGLKVFDFKNSRIKKLEVPFIKKRATDVFIANKIIKDFNNNIWCFIDDYGVVVYSGKTQKVIVYYSLADMGIDGNLTFFDACFINNEDILIGTSRGLKYIYFSDGYKLILGKKNIPFLFKESQIFSLYKVDANIYMGSSEGFFRINYKLDEYLKYYETQDVRSESWLQSVRNIKIDNNVLWLGCKNGLARADLNISPIASYFKDEDNKLSLDNVYSLMAIGDTAALIGLEKGLMYINIRKKKFRMIDRNNSYYGIVEGPQRSYIVSNQDGSYVIRNEKKIPISKVYSEFAGFEKVQYNSIVSLGDSVYVLGSESLNGIVLWFFGERQIKFLNTDSKGEKISSNIVNTIFKDSKSNIWILSDNLITIFDNKFRQKKEIVLRDIGAKERILYYFDVREVKGEFWIGSYGTGLINIDSNYNLIKTYSVKDGLCNNGVYKLFKYKDSILLLTTNNGLSLFDLRLKKFRNYFAKDGLHSNSFEENAGTFENSKIYAGGLKGISIIDPQYFTTNTTPPKFYFTNIKTEATDGARDTSNLEMSELKIPNSWLQTNVSFIGLNYSNPERVTYKYRLIGQNNSWVSLGTQNFVNIIGLSPGKYTLEVKAANEDGVWCESKKLILIFLPKWYQTLWFDFAVAMAVIGLLYGFFRYRIGQLKKQQQIRAEIASDLHDDIGSALNTVKVFTHLAKRDVDKMKHINQIEDSVTQAAIGLRDMLWILDDSQDTVQEMLDRIKKFALPVAMANGIALECINDAAGDSQQISSKTKKRNLLLIAKESINNSIKYADCKNIYVTLSQKSNKVTLVITDDGKGFDMATIQKGYGLSNIQHRAKQIKAVAEIVSAPGQGTTVTVKQY